VCGVPAEVRSGPAALRKTSYGSHALPTALGLSLAAQYCEFSGSLAECKAWWKEHHPEVYEATFGAVAAVQQGVAAASLDGGDAAAAAAPAADAADAAESSKKKKGAAPTQASPGGAPPQLTR